jgi:hypothetical protein
MRELSEELERRAVSADGDEELPEDLAERMNIIDVLTREKLANQAELNLLTGVLENTKNFAVTSRYTIFATFDTVRILMRRFVF